MLVSTVSWASAHFCDGVLGFLFFFFEGPAGVASGWAAAALGEGGFVSSAAAGFVFVVCSVLAPIDGTLSFGGEEAGGAGGASKLSPAPRSLLAKGVPRNSFFGKNCRFLSRPALGGGEKVDGSM